VHAKEVCIQIATQCDSPGRMSRAYGLTGKPESRKVRTEITGLGRSSWNELGIRKGIPEIGIRTDFARLVRNLIPAPIYIV
jgi:hypothetical protein